MARTILALFLGLLLVSCSSSRGLEPGEGYVTVDGGKIWYRIVGSGDATPLILIHGGPGAPSQYLTPMERLAADRPVIFYDQLGTGKSDHPTDKSLWTPERFAKELGQLREALGLKKVHLLGHSWGAVVAIEYMRTGPEGVESLVLASPFLSAKRTAEDANELLATMPASQQEIIRRNLAAGTVDSKEYQDASLDYYHRYFSRSDPWPDYLVEAMDGLNTDIYGYMQGPSEFTVTGTLKGYESEDHLPQLKIPVLYTAGRYDEIMPRTVEAFHKLTPGSEIAIIENSAHTTMIDQPDVYMKVVGDFLNRVDEMD